MCRKYLRPQRGSATGNIRVLRSYFKFKAVEIQFRQSLAKMQKIIWQSALFQLVSFYVISFERKEAMLIKRGHNSNSLNTQAKKTPTEWNNCCLISFGWQKNAASAAMTQLHCVHFNESNLKCVKLCGCVAVCWLSLSLAPAESRTIVSNKENGL